jgi:hypothetical protein
MNLRCDLSKFGLYACVVRIKDDEDMVDITEALVVYDHMLFVRLRCVQLICMVRRFLVYFQKVDTHSDSVGLVDYIIFAGKLILFCDCVIPG